MNRNLLPQFVLILCGLLLAGSASGQGLGSSNKLFGGNKTSSEKTTKPAAKTTKRPSAAKKAAPRNAPAAKKAAATRRTRTSAVTTQVVTASDTRNSGKTPPVVTAPASTVNSEEYERLIDEGRDAQALRNYPAAEAAFSRAVKLAPRKTEAYTDLGTVFAEQQRWEDAEKAYRSALAIDKNRLDLILGLSFILTRPVMAANISERYDEAEVLARRALTIAPNNAIANDVLGTVLELRGDIGPETEAAYRKAIAADNDLAQGYAHLGRLLSKQGKREASARAYASAIEKATAIGAKFHVAETLQSESRFKEALPLLLSAVQTDPRNPTALAMLGRVQTVLGDDASAQRNLLAAIGITPDAVLPYGLLSNLYIRQGRLASAKSTLMQVKVPGGQFDKRYLASQFESLGDAFAKNNNTDGARTAYKRAAELDPQRETIAAKLARLK
ncbi:MAG: tetratricopeptide repeat protein [Acidobacteria bacterium]|nr:tetratricopeptide repeat protein [Acidobacteriota bacterium]